MKFEALEDWGKFKKGEKFESDKPVFQKMAGKGILREIKTRKKKVEPVEDIKDK